MVIVRESPSLYYIILYSLTKKGKNLDLKLVNNRRQGVQLTTMVNAVP